MGVHGDADFVPSVQDASSFMVDLSTGSEEGWADARLEGEAVGFG